MGPLFSLQMDLYVEKQCVDLMKQGELKQFILLFDAYFAGLYRYVARRIGDGKETDEIVRLTFLDALGQIQNTPTDTGYLVWLYSLAKPRVWERISQASFPKQQGLIMGKSESGQEDLLARAEKMMNKLSLEEREILRLKFFEEVADGDVMMILDMEEGTIGPRIHRVLKRAHLLLLGESGERHGVYFAELAGFFARVRALEKIDISEAFKLNLKADLMKRIERRDLAVDSELVAQAKKPRPFAEKDQKLKAKGSSDPAKIFVEAVREMREEEQRAFESRERIMDLIDRWKHVLVAAPVVVFVSLVGIFVFGIFNVGVERGYPSLCQEEIDFDGDFADGVKRDLVKNVGNRLCDHFEEKQVLISRNNDGPVDVEFSTSDWLLKYEFAKKKGAWRIQQYARTASGN